MIDFSHQRPISVEDVLPLLAQTDWANTRTPAQVDHLLRHSVYVGAWEGDRLVGFARAVTDDLFRALIEDVIVEAGYRGRGIGKGVMQALMRRLDHVQELTLGCSEANAPFYERLGFRRRTYPTMQVWKGQP